MITSSTECYKFNFKLIMCGY